MKIKTKAKTVKQLVIKLDDREAQMLLSILVDTNEADGRYDFLGTDAFPFFTDLIVSLRDR